MDADPPGAGDAARGDASDRPVRQSRSQDTVRRITGAAIAEISARGISGLTHRRIARRAGVSLSATTYHFADKREIVAGASRAVLDSYAGAFTRLAARAGTDGAPGRFGDFVLRLLGNAAGVAHDDAMAWAELSLDAARGAESRELIRQWDAEVCEVWQGIARATGGGDLPPEAQARSGVDLTIGLIFMVLALGMREDEVRRLVGGGLSLRDLGGSDDPGEGTVEDGAEGAGRSAKARATRERLIGSAIALLIAEGPGALSYRKVARRAGLAGTAPAYYFPTIASLLRASQARLFQQAKDRYRQALSGRSGTVTHVEELARVSATVLLREAAEFGEENLSVYSIWLEAARDPALRPMIRAGIADQWMAWNQRLASLTPRPRPVDGLLLQALFIGKLIRLLSTGARRSDLAAAEEEMARDMRELLDGRFWI